MQVNAIDDNISSVTLGQAVESESFKVSSNAAFFQTLSKSLYSMPELAVMREVVCNSWDAHISVGITDKPVEISTDGLTISFRDFGTGIAPEMMSEIYATYGASTKTQDSSVTGGFGLGCKSPFAVTDSFQVASYFGGKKSIYNVVLVDETTGLPSMSCIAQSPTEETGIEVTITFDSRNQFNDCIGQLRTVITSGDIKATIDGYPIARLDMPFTEGSYTIIDSTILPENTEDSEVIIRYGNAVYPVNHSDAEVTRAVDLLSVLIDYLPAHQLCKSRRKKILLQTAPNTISVAPSREVLSYQSLTKESLVNLCLETMYVVVDKLKKDWASYKLNYIKHIETIVSGLSSYEKFLSTSGKYIIEAAEGLLTQEEKSAAQYIASEKLVSYTQFKKFVSNTINKLMVKQLLTLDTPYSKHIALLVYWDKQGFTKSNWGRKNKRKLNQDITSKVHDIMENIPKGHKIVNYKLAPLRETDWKSFKNHISQKHKFFTVLQHKIEPAKVVASIKANISIGHRLENCPDINVRTDTIIHVVLPRKKVEQQECIQSWINKGHLVVNLEEKHAWDPETRIVKPVIEKTLPQEQKVTLFIHHLDFMRDTTSNFRQKSMRTPVYQLGKMPKGIQAKYYMSNLNEYQWFTSSLRRIQRNLLKDVIKHTVVSHSATSTAACKKLGLKPLQELLDTYITQGAVMHSKVKGKSGNYVQVESIHNNLQKLNLSFPMIKALPTVQEVNYTVDDLYQEDHIGTFVNCYYRYWRNQRTRMKYPHANHKHVLDLYSYSGSSDVELSSRINKLRILINNSVISDIVHSENYIKNVAGTQEGVLLREYVKLVLKRLKAKLYDN